MSLIDELFAADARVGMLADVRVLELDGFLQDMGIQASGGDDRAKRLLAILDASGPPAQ